VDKTVRPRDELEVPELATRRLTILIPEGWTPEDVDRLQETLLLELKYHGLEARATVTRVTDEGGIHKHG
jgi:hypothetical protein